MDDDLVDRLLADPPLVHRSSATASFGSHVWATEDGCYRFLASAVGAGDRTLETGLGVSTAIFAARGAAHTCVVPHREQVDLLRAYCEQKGIALDRVEFSVGWSEQVLPTLERSELDLVFIDGGHGFPTPMIDWFYGAGRLRSHGTVVIDDLQCPAVEMLTGVLRSDARWAPIGGTAKWAAFERLSAGPLREEWIDQPHLSAP